MSDHKHVWEPDWPGAFYCEVKGCGVRRCSHGYLAGDQCNLADGHKEMTDYEECPHIFMDGQCVDCDKPEPKKVREMDGMAEKFQAILDITDKE